MEKMRMASLDIAAENVEKIAALFPNCVTEAKDSKGNLKKAIDFDKLRQILSNDIAEGERYEFTWVGKNDAIREAYKIEHKTLRPCPKESKDWDTTQNLYIEGDNLDALKLLRESYLGKVKMIYIDPPYNTGKDSFVYPDNYTMDKEKYEDGIGLHDENGNRLFTENSITNPRFHSDWCSMMYSRLLLARDLLSEDGVIFMSIDDNEQENLKKICDEVFGAGNFVAQLVWEKKKKGSFLSSTVTNVKEYIIVYAKNIKKFSGLIGEVNNDAETYPCVNAVNKREIRTIPSGIESKYKEKNFFLPKGYEISDTTMSIVLHSDLRIKDGVLEEPLSVEGNWRYSQQAMEEYARNKELYITRDLYLRRIVSETRNKTLKDLLFRVGNNMPSETSSSSRINLNNLGSSGWGSNEDADEELRLLFGVQKLLDYPKPVRLLEKLIASYRKSSSFICMDFFSGSATTAHAVMKLNAEDGGNRRFIMVQLPEPCAEDTEAAKAGYANICEIGKERIRRAGAKIKKEAGQLGDKLDTGFRVLKVADSNMEEVYYEPDKFEQANLPGLVSNIKKDRSALDLLFACLLEWGIPLDKDYHSEEVDGFRVHFYEGSKYVACFDANVSTKLIEEIARRTPEHIIFRDSCFPTDAAKINMFEICKRFMPEKADRIHKSVRVL
ncbi:site-specific DNA-methyltransferase [Mailhella sp.]